MRESSNDIVNFIKAANPLTGARRYFIDLSRKELAKVSYFPGLEIKRKTEAEWIEDVLIPVLLPVVRRKNKKISEVPITFWIATRQTARPFWAELFLFMTPATLGAVANQAIEKALQNVQFAKIFAGVEAIPEYAFPICQVFRGKLIKFYYGTEDVEDICLPAFKWGGAASTLTLLTLDKTATVLDNRDSEILLIRAVVNSVMNGEYYRKFQQALNCIGIEE